MKQDKYKTIGIFGICPIDLLPKLKHNELRAYISLASFMGGNDSAFPGLDKLSERAGISKQETSKAISQLVKLGFVYRIRRYGQSNIYKIMVPSHDHQEIPDNPKIPDHSYPKIPDHKYREIPDNIKEQFKRSELKDQNNTPNIPEPDWTPQEGFKEPTAWDDPFPSQVWDIFFRYGSNLSRTSQLESEIHELKKITSTLQDIETKVKQYRQKQKEEEWFKKRKLTLKNLLFYWNELGEDTPESHAQPRSDIPDDFLGLDALEI